MNIENGKLNSIDKLSVFVLFLGILPTVFPMVTLIVPGVIISNFCFGVWFVLACIDSRYSEFMKKVKNIYPLLVLAIVCLVSEAFDNTIFVNRYLGISLLFFGTMIYEYYRSAKRLDILKYVILMLLPFIAFTAIRTAIGLNTNSYLARSIKSEGAETEALYRQGYSGYSLIYGLSIASPIMLYCFMKEKNKKLRALYLIGFIVSIYTIIKANYMTALVTIVVSNLFIIVGRGNKSKAFTIFTIIGITVFIIFVGDPVVRVVANVIMKYAGADGRVGKVLSIESGSIIENIYDAFISGRFDRIKGSFDKFFENFLFGISVHQGIGRISLSTLGQHSHIADTLAIWGALFGTIILRITFRIFRKEYFEDSRWILSVAVALASIVILGFNNAINSVFFVMYIVYPYVYEHYGAEDKYQLENDKNGEKDGLSTHYEKK